jgi:hypothetical protein
MDDTTVRGEEHSSQKYGGITAQDNGSAQATAPRFFCLFVNDLNFVEHLIFLFSLKYKEGD